MRELAPSAATTLSDQAAPMRRLPRSAATARLIGLAAVLLLVVPAARVAAQAPHCTGKPCGECTVCDECGTPCCGADENQPDACGNYECRQAPSCAIQCVSAPAGTQCTSDSSGCPLTTCPETPVVTCGTDSPEEGLPGAAGAIQYLHSDALGSTRMATSGDEYASANARYDYLPFGEAIPPEVNGRNADPGSGYVLMNFHGRQKFTGKERDVESQLDYFGARYYSATMGRFVTPDAPFADQDPANPQSWNLYAYVRNSPLSSVDPDGRAGHRLVWAPRPGSPGARWVQQRHALMREFKEADTLLGKAWAYAKLGLHDSAILPSPGIIAAPEGAVANLGAAAVSNLGDDAAAATGRAGTQLADDALVVRGGVPTAEQLTNGAETVAANGNLSGVSVNSANGATVETLSQGLKHNKVGVTTAGEVRRIGGEVVPAPSAKNPNHCLICDVAAQALSDLLKVIRNPSKL